MTGERPHPLTPVVRAWMLVVAAVGFLVIQILEGRDLLATAADMPLWLLAPIAALVISFLLGLWEWWTTRFVIDDTELRVERRGLSHQSKRIAYSRIQSVDLVQPFAARLLGLAQLTIEVGAESGTTLSYLSRARAVELRDHLLRLSHGAPAHEDAPASTTSVWDDLAEHDTVLVRLRPTDLIVGALLSHELWFTVLFLGGPVVAASFIEGIPVQALGAGVIPMLLAVARFISVRVLGQFRYSLADTPDGLKITRGMTTLRTHTVPVGRVQAIRIRQSFLWRLIGRHRVELVVLGKLGLEGEDNDGGAELLPIGTDEQMRLAIRAVWPTIDYESIPIISAPRRARWRAPLTYRWLGFGADDNVVVARSGLLTRVMTIIPHARLQSLAVRQGPLQRRLELATVDLHTSGLEASRILHTDAAPVKQWVYDEARRARTAQPEPEGAPPPAIPD